MHADWHSQNRALKSALVNHQLRSGRLVWGSWYNYDFPHCSEPSATSRSGWISGERTSQKPGARCTRDSPRSALAMWYMQYQSSDNPHAY